MPELIHMQVDVEQSLRSMAAYVNDLERRITALEQRPAAHHPPLSAENAEKISKVLQALSVTKNGAVQEPSMNGAEHG